GHTGREVHKSCDALDQILDIAERARLGAVAVKRYRLPLQRLYDKVRNHPPIIGMHAGTVGVEYASNANVDAKLAMIVKEQSFGAALALVITGSRTDRIDAATIAFYLRVDSRITVDFACRCLKHARPRPFGQAKHVNRTMYAGLDGLHRIELVVYRRGGTSEIVNLVDFDIERKGNVVPEELKTRLIE